MGISRRNLLVLGGAALGYGALSAGYRLWPGARLAFEPLGQPAGFRRIAGQGVSVANAGLVGIDQRSSAPVPQGKGLCNLTFEGAESGPGRLAIASFSDFFCPYCRVLDMQLHDIVADMPSVHVIWHQVPLLGRPSQLAARGALAAMDQGAFESYQARLTRTSFVPTPAYLRAFSDETGLDTARFMKALDAPATQDQIARSISAFRAFGFVGTPGLVVGRTLVAGVISPRELRQLIDLELNEGPPPGCLA